MLTASEARKKVGENDALRLNRIIAWVQAELPNVEKAILQAVERTAYIAYYTVTVMSGKDSPALYIEVLVNTIQDNGYTVRKTSSKDSGTTHNPGTIYNLEIDFSESKVYR